MGHLGKPVVVLGINFFYHDSTAAIIVDGKLVAAVEEERLTRKKHTSDFPVNAIKKVLEIAGLKSTDVDHVAVSIDNNLHKGKKLAYALNLLLKRKNARAFINHEFLWSRAKIKQLNHWFYNTFTSSTKLHFVEHHLAHLLGTFNVSPYESAALMSVDGSGEWATAIFGHAATDGGVVEYDIVKENYFPMSLGSVYEAATEYCGFQPNYDEGKTMGLAPMGDQYSLYNEVSKMFWVDDSLGIHVDLSWFDYQNYGQHRFSQKFIDAFGPARKKDKKAPFEKYHLDIAAAFQYHLEECMLKLARTLKFKYPMEDYLVIAGGVSLNSVANGRIVRESGFKDVYVQAAAGDNGTASGAAYYVYNNVLGKPRTEKQIHMNPHVGTSYSDDDIFDAIQVASIESLSEYWPDQKNLVEAAVNQLKDGKIGCWFQGAMEIGPRALGSRSIIANPTLDGIKDTVNARVKHREAYRPFAPSCTLEDSSIYFDTEVEDPFMLKVCDVRPEWQKTLVAITHVDGTARLQTVNKDTNPLYHMLLKECEKQYGVPVILNTSFNVMGEPIVESPMDAIRCFFTTGLDFLVIGNYIIYKELI